MKTTIKSRILKRTLEFSIPGSSYIYVDLNGHSGSLGNQICWGGGLSGSTMSYHGDNEAEFRKLCQSWYRSYIGKHGSLDRFAVTYDL